MRAHLESVTVMFTDLVGSTALRARVGEEAADELRLEHDAILTRIITDRGGETVKHLGDGAMVFFPSATDAVAAAIDLQRAFDRRNRSADEILFVRIGMSVGDVSRADGDGFGLPVVEAQRLEAAAAPGQILCSELVVRMTRGRGGHTFKPFDRLDLKGIDEPVTAFEVPWELAGLGRTIDDVPELVTAARNRPLVGRRDELGRLLEVLDDVERGDGRTVFVGGPVGIGKSRLVSEVAAQLHRDGGMVLSGGCDPILQAPFDPIAEALRWYVERSSDDELALVLGGTNAVLGELVPEVRHRLPDTSPLAHSDADTRRRMLLDAVASWLARLGERQPVCLFLDDLQWADEATLLVLRHLALRTPGRTLILGTYRDSEVATGGLLDQTLYDQKRRDEPIVLSGLDPAAVAELVGNAGADRIADVVERTAGNPLFVVEVARALRDGTSTELPSSVRDSVVRRASALGPSVVELLQHAAVAGREFTLQLASGVTGRSVGEVLADLDAALAAQLIEERGAGRYAFPHDLVQEALYRSLSETRRAVAHHDIAELIAARPETDPSELATHHRMAAPVFGAAEAVKWAVEAGMSALARSPHDAARWLTDALELSESEQVAIDRPQVLGALGLAELRAGHPTHARRLLAAADAAAEIGDAELMAQVLVASGRVGYTAASGPDPAKIERLRRCLDLLDDHTPALRAEVLSTLAVELVFVGEVAERKAVLDEAIELAMASEELATMHRVSIRTNQVYPRRLPRGEHDDRWVATQLEILDRLDELDDTSLLIEALTNSVFWLFERGDIAGSRAAAARIGQIARDHRDPYAQRYVEVSGPLLAFVDDDLAESERQAEEALAKWTREGVQEAIGYYTVEMFAIRREQGRLAEFVERNLAVVRLFPPVSTAVALLGVALAESGEHGAARRVLDAAGAEGFDRIVDDAVCTVTTALWADLASQLHDATAAAALYPALQQLRSDQIVTGGLYLGARDHYLALLESVLGLDDEAARNFDAAIDGARRTGSTAWVARGELAWARHLRGRGDSDAARACAQRALDAIGGLPFDASKRRAIIIREV